jgi:SAM-dependent MidA family methyltransferase
MMRGGKLCEMYVGLDQAGQIEWTLGSLSTSRLAEYFEFVGVQLAEGQRAEVNLASEDWLTNVAARLSDGYVVTVDYGAEASDLYDAPERSQGTLRSFQRHRFADDVLAHPGEQDITATVDWTFVRRVGEKLGLETIEFLGQDQFLLKCGLLEELELMVEGTQDEGLKQQLRTSSREMILPGGMAGSFQVLVQKISLP